MKPTYDCAAPLVAIDHVLEVNDQEIRVVKAISGNESFFPGHYPNCPIFPGNFILETVHQAIHYYVAEQFKTAAWVRLREVKSIRFLAPFWPGDRLEVICHCSLSPAQDHMDVEAQCLNGAGKTAAKMKLHYSLDER